MRIHQIIWIYLLFGMIFILIIVPGMNAQNMIFSNPVDINNPIAGFTNPALIAYQESQVLFGMKVFHLGFLDDNSLGFKNGFFQASVPYLIRGRIGVSVNGQYFNSPMYSQTNFSIGLSQKYMSIFSIGLRANLFSKAYNRSEFDLEVPDPIFEKSTTKFAFSLTGSIFVSPMPNLYLSIGAEHINRPNIALSTAKYYQPVELIGGVKYGFGKFNTSFYFRKSDQDFHPCFEIEPILAPNINIRLGYGMQALRLDGMMDVYEGFAVGYCYDYPISEFHGSSFGSHQISLTYFLDKEPGLPEKLKPNNLNLHFQMPESDLWLQPRFEVYSTVTSLEIIDKQIVRKLDSTLTEDELKSLINFELGGLDSSATYEPQFLPTRSVGAYYPDVKRVGFFTKGYQETLDQLDSLMQDNTNLKTEIITTRNSSHRAAGIQNYLMKNNQVKQEQVDVVLPVFHGKSDSLEKSKTLIQGGLNPTEYLTVLTHEFTKFYIFPIYFENYDREWKLRIYDSHDNLVKEFKGKANVPHEIIWDWRRNDQTLIAPDLYYYTFLWTSSDDKVFESPPKIIDVRKIKRHLIVTVTKEPKPIQKNIKKIGIRLNR
ncbi:type IX secretion system membrane protein PorP/SprF [candidate division KSB1 bacterium]|nr:type IX secretion system membrane protein PorP/SprF [candidate division KSB1 bacterium]